jgi:predicted nucleic acid-binding protein
MSYFDATFLVRLYVDEPGHERVREIVEDSPLISSSLLGKMETEAAFHRKLRERSLTREALTEINQQLLENSANGMHQWLPLTPAVLQRVHSTFVHLPAHIYLRAGDAIHLATASEAGFKEIYSNDRHLLAAASLFKLKGINPLER